MHTQCIEPSEIHLYNRLTSLGGYTLGSEENYEVRSSSCEHRAFEQASFDRSIMNH